MKETLSDYWQYLKYPSLLKLSADKSTLKREMPWLLLLSFAFTGLVILAFYTLLYFKLIKEYEEFDVFQYGIWVGFALGCIVAPLSEEFIFRWQLRKLKLSIYFFMLSAAITASLFVENDYAIFFIYISSLLIAAVANGYIEKLSKRKAYFFWKAYYVFLFYYTAILFGFIHISNAKGLTISDPSFVLYISSQIFGGLTMGYIRVKYGIWYSVLFHACFNLVALSLMLALI